MFLLMYMVYWSLIRRKNLLEQKLFFKLSTLFEIRTMNIDKKLLWSIIHAFVNFNLA